MRKSLDGLWTLTVEHLARDALRGELFAFMNKRRPRHYGRRLRADVVPQPV